MTSQEHGQLEQLRQELPPPAPDPRLLRPRSRLVAWVLSLPPSGRESTRAHTASQLVGASCGAIAHWLDSAPSPHDRNRARIAEATKGSRYHIMTHEWAPYREALKRARGRWRAPGGLCSQLLAWQRREGLHIDDIASMLSMSRASALGLWGGSHIPCESVAADIGLLTDGEFCESSWAI